MHLQQFQSHVTSMLSKDTKFRKLLAVLTRVDQEESKTLKFSDWIMLLSKKNWKMHNHNIGDALSNAEISTHMKPLYLHIQVSSFAAIFTLRG